MTKEELQNIEDMLDGKAMLNEDEINEWLRKDVSLLIAEIRRLMKQATLCENALLKIRNEYGKVCGNYELCHHQSCESSYGAWATADEALRNLTNTYEKSQPESTGKSQ